MLKRWRTAIFIAMGVTLLVFIADSLFVFADYSNNPELYALNSAPWYTRIIVNSLCFGFLLLLEAAAQFVVCRKIKRSESFI